MKKILSMLLVVLMLVGMLPMGILSACAATVTYNKVTDTTELGDGDQIIIACDIKSAAMGVQSGSYRKSESVTFANNAITDPSTAIEILTLEASGSSYALKTSDGQYLYWDSSNSVKTRADAYDWNITVSSGTATIVSAASTSRKLQYNSSSPRFACYTSSQTAIQLYKLEVATEPEPTEPPATEPPVTEPSDCDHVWTEWEVTTAATCEKDGLQERICEECFEVEKEVIQATGHSWGNWIVITAPGCETTGDSARECTVCKAMETRVDAATGHTYVDGACSVCHAEKPANYVLTDPADIQPTDFVIIVATSDGATYAMSNDKGTGSAPAAVAVTVTNGEIAKAADNLLWNITYNGGNMTIYPNGETKTWLYGTSSNNGIRVGTGTDNIFIIDEASGYLKNTGTNRYLGVYISTPDWRCYTSSTATNIKNQTFAFYVKANPNACKHTETVTIPAQEPTCTEDGYTEGVQCANPDCGIFLSGHMLREKTGHDWTGEWTVTTPATCDEAGIQKTSCVNGCGSTKEEAINATGHNYGDGNICLDCGNVKATGVSYVKTELADILPTDEVIITMTTADGTTYAMGNDLGTEDPPAAVTVTVADNTLTSDAANIFWNITNTDGTLNIYPAGTTAEWLYCTNTNNGIRVGTNSAKDFTVDADTGYLKHTGTNRYLGVYISTPDWRCYTNTTGNTAGQTLAFYVKKEADTLKFSSANLVLESNLTIKFNVKASLFEGEGAYTEPYAVFSINGRKTQTVTDYEIAGDKYVFTCSNIAPSQMSDSVDAVLYATKNGVLEESPITHYGVSVYCYNVLAKPEHANIHPLLVDLLNYGAAAQTYSGYKHDDLCNSALTEAQQALGNYDDPELSLNLNTKYATVENPQATWTAASLVLEHTVTMRFRFAAESIEGLTAQIQVGGQTFTSTLFEADTSREGQYYVYFSGIMAHQMRETVLVTLFRGDAAISNTLSYSIESYAYSMQDVNKVGLLVKAMMRYGDAATKYSEQRG